MIETRINKYMRAYCAELYDNKNLSDSQQFEIFSTCMIAISNAIHCDKDTLKQIWLDDNLPGIDGFFILVDNAIYSIKNYMQLFDNEKQFKDVEFFIIEAKNSSSVDSGSLQKSYYTIKELIKCRGEHTNRKTLEIYNCIDYFDTADSKNNKSMKINFYFCTQKDEKDTISIRSNWQDIINLQEDEIKQYIEIETSIIGSEFLRKSYESTKDGIKMVVPKEQLIFMDNSIQCCVGYINISQIMEVISFDNNSKKTLKSGIFDDNIRLF